MNNVVASRAMSLRFIMALASAAALVSCSQYGSDVEAELLEGREFIVTVRNGSNDPLVIDNRLFSSSIESSLRVEVAHAGGSVIAPCDYLDYVGTGSRLTVPPGEQAVLSVQLTAITVTRCLTPSERYSFRAVLVSGDQVLSSSDWVPFQAASLD